MTLLTTRSLLASKYAFMAHGSRRDAWVSLQKMHYDDNGTHLEN
jgi:hypothetical protein